MEETKKTDSVFQRLFSNKIILALFFFGLGAATVWSYNRYVDFKKSNHIAFSFNTGKQDPLNDDMFGRDTDPFDQMRRMQEQMEKMMENPNVAAPAFGGLPEDTKVSAAEVKQHEDENFVYIDILLKDKEAQGVNVEVRGGQISITGETQSKDEGMGATRMFTSSFHRSFPIPPNVDSENYKMEQKDDRITLKFPKLKDA